jgi:hypothetical protein
VSTAAVAQPPELEADAPTRAEVQVGRLGVVALIALAPLSIIYLSFNQGGFFPNATGIAAIGFAAALTLRTTLAEHPFAGYNRQLGLLMLALGAFGAWQLASGLWSHDTARALDEYDRTLLYLLALALFGSLPRTSARLRWLIRALAAGMTAVCLAGLISRVLPHLWPTAATYYANRLNYPLSYWNTEGFLAAAASLLLIHIAASEDEHPLARVIAAVFVPATAATLLLTFSRGALAVAIIGVVAYLLLGRPRAIFGAAVAIVPTAAISFHGAYAALLLASNTPTSAAAVVQGRHLAKTIALCMLAAGVLRAVTLPVDSWLMRKLARVQGPRVSRTAVLVTGSAVVLVAVLALVLSGFVGRAYDKFAHGSGPSSSLTRSRLTDPSGEIRVETWSAALRDFKAHPLAGSGAGSYELYYAQHRTSDGSVTDAHSIYLQTLAETGILGSIALAVAVLGIIVLIAVRVRGPERAVYAVLFATALAWAIHAAADWLWETPAVTLWLFIAGGAALATAAGSATRNEPGPRNRVPMALGWLALAIAPLLIGVSYQRLRASGQDLTAGNCVQARRNALSSISLLAVRPQAYEIISFCDLQLGFPIEGLQAAQKAVHYEGNNWNYRFGLAIARGANGLDPRPEAAYALRLNPREPILQDAVSAFARGGPSDWEQMAPPLLLRAQQTGRLAVSNL